MVILRITAMGQIQIDPDLSCQKNRNKFNELNPISITSSTDK